MSFSAKMNHPIVMERWGFYEWRGLQITSKTFRISDERRKTHINNRKVKGECESSKSLIIGNNTHNTPESLMEHSHPTNDTSIIPLLIFKIRDSGF